MGCSSSSLNKTVIVVGSGYGGCAAAKELEAKGFTVTVISPFGSLAHKYTHMRACVKPGWEAAVRAPLDKLLKNGTVVKGEVTSVERGKVTLKDGSTLTADYIVLAQGAPVKPTGPSAINELFDDEKAAREAFVAKQKDILASQSILIVGAGPVGLELAGEIKALYPTKKLVVVQSKTAILSNSYPKFIDKFVQGVEERLKLMGIELITGAALADAAVLSASTDGFVKESREYALTNGTSVQADLVVNCTGGKKVATSIVPTTSVDADSGLVKVNSFLCVDGLADVFCVGDANNIKETKLGYFASLHAKIVAANIANASAGKALKAYTPANGSDEFGTMFLPLGPKKGISVMVKTILTDGTTSTIKGKGLFKKMIFKSVNAAPPVIKE